MSNSITHIEIRRATPNDAGVIAGILRELHWFEHLSAETQETTTARVQGHIQECYANDSHTIYVADAGFDRVLGYVNVHWLPYLFMQGPEGYISELFVGEAARGHGVGSRLLDVVVRDARVRGCVRLSLINMRYRTSYERRFYQKYGFEERPLAANLVYFLD